MCYFVPRGEAHLRNTKPQTVFDVSDLAVEHKKCTLMYTKISPSCVIQAHLCDGREQKEGLTCMRNFVSLQHNITLTDVCILRHWKPNVETKRQLCFACLFK